MMASESWLCRHFHISLQSGDDQVLERMNRKYTAGDFARLVELCILMVKPKGMLMLIAQGEQSDPAISSCFVIREGSRLDVRVQPELDLPLHHRHNRDLIAKMSPFKLVKSYIYRSGLREFLFQHP